MEKLFLGLLCSCPGCVEGREQAEAGTTTMEWYFTFGSNNKYHNRFVVIQGTKKSARQKMISIFGLKWAGQYESAEETGVKRWNLQELKIK